MITRVLVSITVAFVVFAPFVYAILSVAELLSRPTCNKTVQNAEFGEMALWSNSIHFNKDGRMIKKEILDKIL